MKELSKGTTLEKASMRAGMSEDTARRYRKGARAKGARPTRTYRTRRDPFAAVWSEVVAMLEAAPGLEAKTIFERLCEREDASFSEGQLRTLQRKIKQWRAEQGPGKEVFFPQQHRPGEYAQSDFTSMKDLCITIGVEYGAGEHLRPRPDRDAAESRYASVFALEPRGAEAQVETRRRPLSL